MLRMAKPIPCLAGVMLLSAVPAFSQDDATEALRKEIQAMRQEYETRIQKLESRIVELEEAPAPRKSAPAAARRRAATEEPVAPAPADPEVTAVADEAREWRQRADEQFEGDTETRDIARRPDAEKALDARIEEVLEGYLDITGYFRAGYGRSDAGGPQRAFGIPGVAKYRLGNEAENYGELAFAKTFFPSGLLGGSKSGGVHDPVARMNLRLAFYNPYDNYGSSSDTDFSVPELWASIANVIPGMPEAKFWAGSRFYRRHDIHINDFYFWDMSGGGAGIEDVPLGAGKFAFAWIGDGAESAIYNDIATPDPLNIAGFSKGSFDFRWYDWPFFGGKGEVGFAYSRSESGVDSTGIQADDSNGFSLSLVRTREGFLDAKSLHKTSLQFGTGPAKTFSTGFENFSGPAGTFVRPDPDESWRARVTDQWVVKPLEHLSIGSSLVYQYTEFGDNAPYQHWASAGVRPIWHFNDTFSIALEPGVD
jgi:maltoporin